MRRVASPDRVSPMRVRATPSYRQQRDWEVGQGTDGAVATLAPACGSQEAATSGRMPRRAAPAASALAVILSQLEGLVQACAAVSWRTACHQEPACRPLTAQTHVAHASVIRHQHTAAHGCFGGRRDAG